MNTIPRIGRFLKRYILPLSLLIAQTGQAQAQDSTFHLEIQRMFSSEKCISGYLLVNGTVVCYVLERPWKENEPEISAIPAGEYSASIREDGPKGWRIELAGVPSRTNIQIHIGNEPANSKGCLLPGKRIDEKLCAVKESAEAMRLLKASLAQWQEKLQQSVPIKVKISGLQ